MQVTATDADDPTYGNSARLVYSILQGQPYFSVEPQTGKAGSRDIHHNQKQAYSPGILSHYCITANTTQNSNVVSMCSCQPKKMAIQLAVIRFRATKHFYSILCLCSRCSMCLHSEIPFLWIHLDLVTHLSNMDNI